MVFSSIGRSVPRDDEEMGTVIMGNKAKIKIMNNNVPR
ncbi:hypothetical protein EZBTHKR_1634 [Elizabethkingia anophelis]|nr:hypothetical protein EZBTHKR_1634 [Elizabethkingia anophelis]